MKKIIFTGGNGRFGKIFRTIKHKEKIFFPTKKELNIKNIKSIEKYIKKNKTKYFIHCAGLSRPMDTHTKDINKSIDLNIIATSNIVKACNNFNIKLIYFSTNYVYPGVKGQYLENNPLLPINNYALSKLGGECAVQMYKNSLILRICMTEKPFIHKKAFSDVDMNFMFHEDLAKNLLKLIDCKGILNVGGKTQSVYNFAKKNNKNVIKTLAKKTMGSHYPLKQSMNVNKYLKIIKN
tara:strand:- start:166 stop:876 length:711 start_codon:yes stop_codon:yes gene_type:complete